MPSILKIRVIKARNLLPESEEFLEQPALFYSTLKLIESTELHDDSSGSPYSTSVLSNSLNYSDDDEIETGISGFDSEKKFGEQSFFNRRRQLEVERAKSPSNFTFRTKTVQCNDGSPKWDQDFRLEVTDDAQLQDTPLQLHLYRDTSTWIGSLTVDLNPLLARDSPYGICGWFPLMMDKAGCNSSDGDGINGPEIYLQAKIQFFGDSNPFKESSAGVQFFCTSEIPSCIKVKVHVSFIYLFYILNFKLNF